MIYTFDRLEWHLDDERKLRTPQGTVWSCQVAGESFEFAFNRPAAAHAKSQDHRASCGVFAFGSSGSFVELKREMEARLHVGCIAPSVATCLMLGDDQMAKQQGVLGVYLVRIQTTRQSYLTDRQGALAKRPAWAAPKKHRLAYTPQHRRPALIERLVKTTGHGETRPLLKANQSLKGTWVSLVFYGVSNGA